MLPFSVDTKRCTRCGQCVRDCPTGIIEMTPPAVPHLVPGREEDCMQCQHCLAVCPNAALSILGRHPDDSRPLAAGSWPSLDQMDCLTRGRRSVRQYRQENVDPALVQRLLASLANVPTGVNRRALTFTVIDDQGVMQQLRRRAQEGLTAAADSGRLGERWTYLANIVQRSRESGRDILLRGAPHALLVSAPPEAPCPQEDVVLALAYFELLAHSAGLGTVWCGLLKGAIEALPDLKAWLGIPAGHLYYSMLFGHPAVHYARTVQRDNAAQVRRVGA